MEWGWDKGGMMGMGWGYVGGYEGKEGWGGVEGGGRSELASEAALASLASEVDSHRSEVRTCGAILRLGREEEA